jgi:hypothetical protein
MRQRGVLQARIEFVQGVELDIIVQVELLDLHAQSVQEVNIRRRRVRLVRTQSVQRVKLDTIVQVELQERLVISETIVQQVPRHRRPVQVIYQMVLVDTIAQIQLREIHAEHVDLGIMHLLHVIA